MGNHATMFGDLLAGIDRDEIEECPLSILIEFESVEAIRKALNEGKCEFEIGPKPSQEAIAKARGESE